MQEPVIEDGGNQPHPLGRLAAVLGTDDSPLAKHVALLLPGDRFRHLEDYFHKSIQGQCFGSLEEDTRLADVLNFPLRPGAQISNSIAQRNVQFQTPGARYPGRFLRVRSATSDCRLRHGVVYTLDTAHRLPIVFVLSRAQEAHLVILAVGSTPGPGELVGAAAKYENLQI